MTKPPSHDWVMKPYKSIVEYPKKAKGMSFFAFIFSIFIYISIFYIFNLSPSIVFNNTKFWFLISNTLILIIAVDYGSFSSSKGKVDVYDEYLRHSQARTTTTSQYASSYSSPSVSLQPETVKKSNITHTQEEEDQVETTNIVQEKQVMKALEKSDDKLQIVTKNDQEKLINDDHGKDIQEKRIIHVVDQGVGKACEEGKKMEAKTYRRSKSEKAKRVVIDEGKNINLRRSETNKLKEEESHVEENEFSSMSDEQLNRRVEEFIQKFNRQIRQQAAARNFQQV